MIPTPQRLVRFSLLALVIVIGFYVVLSRRDLGLAGLNPKSPAPVRPIPVDVAEGQRIAWEYSLNDNYSPEPGNPARTYQEHYFQEVETVPM